MKTIIAGSRNITDYKLIEDAVRCSGFDVSEIVSGAARGVDQLGEEYAKKRNIPIKKMPADWDKFGKSAGYRRNAEMALYADALVAIWDGKRKGTKHMIDLAIKHNLCYYIYTI